MPEIAPLTPQSPSVRTTAQISWSTRSRVVVSAYPTRHMNKIFSTVVHFTQTPSPGARANHDVKVIQKAKSKVNTTNGVIGSCTLSLREMIQDRHVKTAMTKA